MCKLSSGLKPHLHVSRQAGCTLPIFHWSICYLPKIKTKHETWINTKEKVIRRNHGPLL